MQLSSISLAISRLLPGAGGVLPPATDPLFDYVTLLLNTSATNGAQNNTFLDSSTNNFSITRNGNTTQGTFSPFSQTGWSNFFDGTGDYLSVADNTALQILSGGDFTIESWVYITATPSANGGPIIGKTATDAGYMFRISSAPKATWTIPGVAEYQFGPTLSLNTWYHVAVCRVGTTVTGYVDGTQYTFSSSNRTSDTTGTTTIGGDENSGAFNSFFTGYISNARVVKGTAVYTANFTPPTSPLANITNTSLLTCQSNRFIDNSSNAFAITPNGDVSVQAFSPFNPTAAWSAGTNGGSGYFDGTGDYLEPPNNSVFTLGTANFTIEAWVYTGTTTQTTIIERRGTGFTTGDWALFLNDTTNLLSFYAADINAVTPVVSGSGFVYNAWNHVAVVRSGSNFKLYINGASVSSATSSTSIANNSLGITIGRDNVAGGRFFWNGYISNVRIVNGTAVYTANFTPPTAPLTAITNTSLLCNFTNAGIYDSASGSDLETVGNAQVSTTQAKFGTTSMGFDGTGDWIPKADRPTLRLGTADFTIEGWVYLNAAGVAYGLISKGAASTGWSVNVTSGNKLQFSYTATQLTGATSLAASTWYHFAVVRSGSASGNLKVYLNGTVDATSAGAVTDDFNQTNIMYVGADRVAGSSLNGYLDEVRITNGVARYTANFTAPTAAFPLN